MLKVPDNAGGQIVTSQVFTDSANATSGVLGLYTGYQLTAQYPDIYTGLTGDELLTTSVYAPNLAYYKDTMTAGSLTVASSGSLFWIPYYGNSGIYLANAAIDGLTRDSLLAPAVRDQLIGECKVVRAFYHFYLVNLFGGIPYVTSPDFNQNRLQGRASIDDVYGNIIADLKDAMAKLKPVYPSTGRQRPNRYTAAALLARAYLYHRQWSDAQAMADTVINSGLYSLVPNLDNVFLDNSKEAIWQIGSSSPSSPKAAPGNSPFLPIVSFLAPTYYLSPILLQAFESGDQRKSHWVGTATVSSGTVPTLYYYANKYKNTSTVNPGNTTEDLMVVRLAELYLIRSEAKARLGDPTGAMLDVNLVRTRAGLTTPAMATNLTDAIGAILHERQTEFFCEWGNRWFDLKRTDSINAVLTRGKSQFWPADGHSALFPIPFTEILYNPNLTQNPGY